MSSSSARISISSDEVNLLIYRYLIEAGFKHSAFVFHGESLLNRSPNLVQTDMPPGTLVTLLQKALLFLYVETHVANDGQTIHCDEAFSLLKPHDHDHGPLDAQIQFDESIAEHVEISGKRVGSSLNEASEKDDSSSSKPPPSKKSKHVKPRTETTDQLEGQDQTMAASDVPAAPTAESEQVSEEFVPNDSNTDTISKPEEEMHEEKKLEGAQNDI